MPSRPRMGKLIGDLVRAHLELPGAPKRGRRAARAKV